MLKWEMIFHDVPVIVFNVSFQEHFVTSNTKHITLNVKVKSDVDQCVLLKNLALNV